jgi:hypothetical protein
MVDCTSASLIPTMSSTTLNSQFDLEQLINRIFKFRQITRLDQQLLMSILLTKEEITEDDNNKINRVFDAVRSGRLQVVD